MVLVITTKYDVLSFLLILRTHPPALCCFISKFGQKQFRVYKRKNINVAIKALEIFLQAKNNNKIFVLT